MLAARKPRGCDPSTTTAIVWPKGGTVIIHPALTALRCDAARPLYPLAVTHVEHGALRHQPGGEIAPQRHDQLAREGDDRNAPEPLAGVERALEEPAAECALRLMLQPKPGELDRFVAGARIA